MPKEVNIDSLNKGDLNVTTKVTDPFEQAIEEAINSEKPEAGVIYGNIENKEEQIDIAMARPSKEFLEQIKKNDNRAELETDDINEEAVTTTGITDDKAVSEDTITYTEITENIRAREMGAGGGKDDLVRINPDDGSFIFKNIGAEEQKMLESAFMLLDKNELPKAMGSINRFLRMSGDSSKYDIADVADALDAFKPKKTLTLDELEQAASQIGLDDLYTKIYRMRNSPEDANVGALNQAETVRAMIESSLLTLKTSQLRDIYLSPNSTKLDEDNYFRSVAQRNFIRNTVSEQIGDNMRVARYSQEDGMLGKAMQQQISKEDQEYLDNLLKQVNDGSMDARTFALMEASLMPYQQKIFHKTVREEVTRRAKKAVKKGTGAFRSFMHLTTELYINAKLSQPLTHLANIGGNIAWNTWRFAEYTALAGYNKAFGIDYDGAIQWNEVMSMYAAFFDGFKEGAVNFGGAIAKGGPVTDGMDKVDLGRPKMISRNKLGKYKDTPLGYAVEGFGYMTRVPTTLLTAEDEFFKGVVGRMELARIARQKYNEAIRAGKSKTDADIVFMQTMREPPPKIEEKVSELAREGTFTKELTFGGGKIQQFMNIPEVKMFVPFYKTLMNISLETVKRVPFANKLDPDTRRILAGDDPAAKALVRTKANMGAGLMVGMSYLAYGSAKDGDKVFITGAAPTNPDELASFRRKNYREYSIMVRQEDGSYLAYDYKRIDPFGQLIGMSADFTYAMSRPGVDMNSEIALETSMALVNALIGFVDDQPLTDGIGLIGDLLDFQGGAEGWAGKNLNKLTRTVTDFGLGTYANPMSALNNQLSQIDGKPIMDYGPTSEQVPEWYRTSSLYGAIEGFYTSLNKIKTQSIFFNDNAEPRLTLFATQMPPPEVGYFSFTRSYREQDSLLDDAMNKYSYYLPMPEEKIKGYRMARDEYNQFLVNMNSQELTSRYGPGTANMVEELTRLVQRQEWIELAEGRSASSSKPALEQREQAYEMLKSVYSRYYTKQRDLSFDDESMNSMGKKLREIQQQDLEAKYGQDDFQIEE
jgi:hypothetical protein